MRTVWRTLISIGREESGAVATEYAVMIALIILVVFAAIAALGTKVSGTFADAEQGF